MKFLTALIVPLLLLAACSPTPPPTGAEEQFDYARELYESGDYARALLEAAEASDKTRSDSLLSEIYVLMSRCHGVTGNFDLQMSFALRAMTTDQSNQQAFYALVEATLACGDAEGTLQLLPEITDPEYVLHRRAQCGRMLGNEYLEFSSLRSLMEADSMALTGEECVRAAAMFASEGKPDSAAMLLRLVEGSRDPATLDALAGYRASTGNRQAEIESLRALARVNDSIMDGMVRRGVYEKLYEISEESRRRDSEAQRQQMTLTLATGAVFILILVVIMLLLLFRRSVERRKALEAERGLLILRQEMEQLRHRSGSLLRERYEGMEMAANLLLDNSFSKKSDANITAALNAEVESWRKPEFLATLEQSLDSFNGGLIGRIRHTVTTLSDADMMLLLYCAAGFSPRVISLLTGRTTNSLYTAKHRLRHKIADSAISDSDKQQIFELI